MSRSVIPAAEAAGARVLTGVRVLQLLKRRDKIVGVVARRLHADGTTDLVRLEAEHVFVCAGPTETPSLLLRSGIKYHVGNTLRIHPYLKIAARFDEIVDAHDHVLPLLQVKEFWPRALVRRRLFQSRAASDDAQRELAGKSRPDAAPPRTWPSTTSACAAAAEVGCVRRSSATTPRSFATSFPTRTPRP